MNTHIQMTSYHFLWRHNGRRGSRPYKSVDPRLSLALDTLLLFLWYLSSLVEDLFALKCPRCSIGSQSGFRLSNKISGLHWYEKSGTNTAILKLTVCQICSGNRCNEPFSPLPAQFQFFTASTSPHRWYTIERYVLVPAWPLETLETLQITVVLCTVAT